MLNYIGLPSFKILKKNEQYIEYYDFIKDSLKQSVIILMILKNDYILNIMEQGILESNVIILRILKKVNILNIQMIIIKLSNIIIAKI